MWGGGPMCLYVEALADPLAVVGGGRMCVYVEAFRGSLRGPMCFRERVSGSSRCGRAGTHVC